MSTGDWVVYEEFGVKNIHNTVTNEEYEVCVDPDSGDTYYVHTVRRGKVQQKRKRATMS